MANADNILKRAYAHWFEDGLAEIGLGGLFAAVGALRAVMHIITDDSPYYWWLAASLFIVMFGYSWTIGRAVKTLKALITYPRTGYVATRPRPRSPIRWILILLLGGAVGGLVGILASQPRARMIEALVPFTMGIVGAAASFYVARRIGAEQFYAIAALSVGVGVAVALLDVDIVLGISLYYFSFGVAQVLVGGVALVRYLRRHGPVDLNAESHDE